MSSPRVRARMDLIKPKKRKKENKPETDDDKKVQYIYSDSKLLKFSFSEKATKICAICLMVFTFTK